MAWWTAPLLGAMLWLVVLILCGAAAAAALQAFHILSSASLVVALSSIFAVASVPNTLALVHAHVQHWVQPTLQLCVVRIVMMVPIYALDSWLGLIQRGSPLADAARECYEAFVIYNFVLFLMHSLGGEDPIAKLLASKRPVNHLWPLNHCLPQWRMGRKYLSICKRGSLQYVVVRLCSTGLEASLQLLSVAGIGATDEDRNLLSVYPYLAIINSGSQGWAMYALVMFYRAVHQELAPLRPLRKFACVKAVVFMTFWQSTAIDFAAAWDLLPLADGWNSKQTAASLKDALLCFQMFLASLLHPIAFPPSDYVSSGGGGTCSFTAALYEALVPKDVASDVAQARWGVLNPRHLGFSVSSVRGRDTSGVAYCSPSASASSYGQISRDASVPELAEASRDLAFSPASSSGDTADPSHRVAATHSAPTPLIPTNIGTDVSAAVSEPSCASRVK